METPDDEDRDLRTVALQNAQAILSARRRADTELLEAKEALERRTEELAQSVALLRATLESAPDAIVVTDPSGRVTDFNERFRTLWRLPPDLQPDRDRVRLRQHIAEQALDPDAMSVRAEAILVAALPESYDLLELRDGRAVERYSRVQSIDGRNVGRVWSFRDITTRRRSEATARFLADASAALAELVSPETTLQRVGELAVPAFADWCSVSLLEASGDLRRVAVTDADAARMASAEALEAGVLRNGKPEWCADLADPELQSCMSVPLVARNRTIGVLTFATIRSGRTYDRNDLAAAEDLAHRVGMAIENANLLGALKDADRRKDEFLAMLAHELRNPLAPIRNAVRLLQTKGPPTPELQWARELIERQVHQLTRLVDDLLDVSRITRGKIELRREPVELSTVLEAAVEGSRPLMEKWGHELVLELPTEAVWLNADLTRLSQVFLNLLNNAAKYTGHGGRIVLSAQPIGRDVQVRVRDNGVGITPEMLPRIFDVFAQADRSLDRAEGGLGIGLTLVRMLVELHRGGVAARSEGPGRGSEFRVTLPRMDGPPPTLAHIRGPEAAPAGRRILVVDDNQDAADSLGMLLKLGGNEVRIAYDGIEAVGAAAVFLPDVVLMDIGLPKLNGFEVARRIRSERGKSVLLIALTGWGQDEDRRRSREAGFDFHLTKPVDLEAIHQLLRDRPIA